MRKGGAGGGEGERDRETERQRDAKSAPAILCIPDMEVKKFSWMFQPQQILHEWKNHPAEFSSDCRIMLNVKM